MKHFRATPVRGTPGEPIVRKGLRALYEAAHEQWGLTATYPSVRNNMLPEGRVYRARDGWVEIRTDAEADAAAIEAEANAAVNDDREVDYMATVYVTVKDGASGDLIEKKFERVRARGLYNLLGEAVALIQDEVGVVPPMLEEAAVRARIPNMRSQMAKSRKAGKPVYSIPFPTIQEGYWTGPFPKNHDYRFYIDIAREYEAPPAQYTLPRR